MGGVRVGLMCRGSKAGKRGRHRLLSRPGNPGPGPADYPGQAGNHYPAAAACGNKTSWPNVGQPSWLETQNKFTDVTSSDIAYGVPCQPNEL